MAEKTIINPGREFPLATATTKATAEATNKADSRRNEMVNIMANIDSGINSARHVSLAVVVANRTTMVERTSRRIRLAVSLTTFRSYTAR